jgi:hypothetical protein
MVWYQKFEYAISHWLQKATEHVIGCVLCSPGCFSLFRGSALMDDNVMQKYTTPPSEARHYVQYDQGELDSVLFVLADLDCEMCTHPSKLTESFVQQCLDLDLW